MKPSAIAIVGMAGRFPGARNIREFWQNLRDGVESVRTLSDVELLAAGVSPEELASPDYVRRASVLDDVPMFDAAFFGFSPRDAAIMDPQHRHFLECAWEALEDAGHPPSSFNGSIGVFAGSGMSTYLIHNLLANRKLLETAGLFQLKQTGNDKDVLSTRVSYQFDLRGPSLNVQTACSTSLVAVHLASQMLLNFECDMALAGGVTIENPHGQGYIYRDGEILSRDGHCRSFDASSSGTVFGSGLGVVVLRRLEDAIADHDNIHGVLLGSAINNDGARKVGFLAPSVEGQTAVITEALEFAGVSAADISFVETHGTGTIVGDPIEVRALTQAFRKSTSRANYCAIGSVKTNVGHLDAAAGVAALIKTVLALKHKQIPASLHFENPNPLLELKTSPFYVNSKLADWPPNNHSLPGQTSSGQPRRAGVTSLGIGGTNAHVILEEAALLALTRESRPYQLLTVSAKSAAAADRALADLTGHLQAHPDLNLADVAFTTQVGRHAFAHRRALVVENTSTSAAVLDAKPQPASGTASDTPPRVVFMFSGQGSQHVNMARELYDHEPVFRETIDLCANHLRQSLKLDLRDALYPSPQDVHSAAAKLNQTWLTQPALFAIEYALARWWISLGIQPAAMVGHSIGEFVAACLAGVFSLEDALDITAYRGRLMYGLPAGSMAAVPLPAGDIYLDGTLSLAAINNPSMCVVSGPTASIAALEERLAKQSIASRRLVTSHAFHSTMMDPILGAFEERLRTITLHPPRLPYLSNVTGTWIQQEEATDPAYWARHLRGTVRFSDNLAELLCNPSNLLVEVGPGNVLATLAREQAELANRQGGLARKQSNSTLKAYSSLPHRLDSTPAIRYALTTLGHLWTQGVNFDSSRLNNPASVQRVSLPTYPFEHQRFWIEPDKASPAITASAAASRKPAEALSFYCRSWKRIRAEAASAPASGTTHAQGAWLIFKDAQGLGDQIAAQLKHGKRDVILVSPGTAFKKNKRDRYTIRPAARADYDALLADLIASGSVPANILHLWAVIQKDAPTPINQSLARCFHSPLALAQSLAALDLVDIEIAFVSNHLQQVPDQHGVAEPVVDPARAVVLGPARVIPKELPGINCRSIDFDDTSFEESAALILTELSTPSQHSTIAYRQGQRYVEILDDLDLTSLPELKRLTPRGVYLITGGLGGLGLAVAEHLGRELNARLVLISRSPLPPESQWEASVSDTSLSESTRDRIRHLLRIRAVSGGLLVLQADVTSVDQMRAAVTTARNHFGKIDGVFHAAGILDDGPLMLKTAESTARVLAPKVQGTLALEEALRDETLRCFVLFSSISSILAPAGQIDYAAANAFLDAFAQSRKGPITVVNWGLWNDVGMGARPRSTHPWLEQLLLNTPNEVVYAGEFSQAGRWLLSEHKLKGSKALIAGTSHLEMVSSAFIRATGATAFEIRDAHFLSPTMFSAHEVREVRVQLRRESDSGLPKGSWRFSVFSSPGPLVPRSSGPLASSSPGPSVPRSPASWIEHATGTIAPSLASLPAPAQLDLDSIFARCNLGEHVFDEKNRRRQENEFDFGPRWRSLRGLRIGNGEALAEIELDAKFAGDLNGIHFHPGLLDMATGASLYLAENYDNSTALYLPITYKTIRTWRPLPARFFSFIRPRRSDSLFRSGGESSTRGEVITFDITLLDPEGRVIAEIEGFSMRRIPDDIVRSLHVNGGARDTSASGGERLIEIPARSAIAPAEGVRALMRILQARSPLAVVAVPQPLILIAESTLPTAFRPAPFAPVAQQATGSENIAATLTAWWQELLGVEQVGLDDDFFALGGHSLIGVRLFARIRKTWSADLELALLFEARTIRHLSEVIAKLRQPAIAKSRVWSALVPIQPNGSRTPLFCVHAIGGDVLFYQQLAHALGPDQPFYAFKSPLISRKEIGDTSLEELASIYVGEMRAVYPRGPYLIGGASFGGNVAFEMARQLHAQGVEPALVVMFDTFVPGHEKSVAPSERASSFLKGIRQGGLPYLGKKFAVKAKYWGDLLRVRGRRLACKALPLAGIPLTLDLRYFLMDEAHRRALARHVFEPYAGKITLMRATDRGPEVLGKREDPTLGWGALAAGGLEIHNVPTEHIYMLFEPFVQQFARILEPLFPQPGDDPSADSRARERADFLTR
jgi:acyl transferase domain-containing protein/thioesterase domain-containing protein